MISKEQKDYGQIAKSTGIFGGSQLVIILSGILRTKVLALLLGATGVGLAGLLQSVVETIRSIAGLGLGFSAVKEVSEAYASHDETQKQAVFPLLKRWSFMTALLGLSIPLVFARSISLYIFENTNYVFEIRLLSIAVAAGIVSAVQMAVLQGQRRIKAMAWVALINALGGLLIATLIYAWLGIKGIVPAILLVTLLSLALTTLYVRIDFFRAVQQSWSETLRKGRNMVQLGIFTMLAALASTLGLFLIKRFLVRAGDLQTVGLFQAAWSVSFMYLGAVLTSMAADYYPKLCGLDKASRNEFANQQTRFVLIVVAPLLVGLLLFAAPVLRLLYSVDFVQAMDMLHWQLLGSLLKVLIWPVGFFLLAENKGFAFLMVECIWFAAFYVFTWLLWPVMGLTAVGLSYLLAYVVYFPLVFLWVRSYTQFSYSRTNLWLLLGYGLLVLLSFLNVRWVQGSLHVWLGGGLCLATLLLSAVQLNRILPFKYWIEALNKRLFK